MSGDTLQALAAVFDVSVAVLQQPLPSEEQVRKAAEEAEKRYKFISLKKIERASDLQRYVGADALQVDHAEASRSAKRMRSLSLKNCCVITATYGPI